MMEVKTYARISFNQDNRLTSLDVRCAASHRLSAAATTQGSLSRDSSPLAPPSTSVYPNPSTCTNITVFKVLSLYMIMHESNKFLFCNGEQNLIVTVYSLIMYDILIFASKVVRFLCNCFLLYSSHIAITPKNVTPTRRGSIVFPCQNNAYFKAA